jgi:hypothetical protein
MCNYLDERSSGTHMIIQPTVDQLAGVGSHSGISDGRNRKDVRIW